jgi:HlyD family secretion protein
MNLPALAPEPLTDDPRARARARRRKVRAALGRAAMGLVLLGVAGAAWLVVRPKPVPVDLAAVRTLPLRVTIDEDGALRVRDRFVVSSPIAGSLVRIALRPGDAVQPGTPLASVRPLAPPLLDERSREQAEARLGAARAARRQTLSAIERARAAEAFAAKELVAARALSARDALAPRSLDLAELEAKSRREELASAELGAKVAEHEVRMAEAALARFDRASRASEPSFVVPSPIAGRVLRVLRQSEGVVQPGEPLVELGDPSSLELVVDVLTSDAVRLPPQACALVERWGGEAPLEARVRLVEPSAFTRVSALGVEEQRVNVLLDVVSPREAWARAGDGYAALARLVVWEAGAVRVVPENAAFRHGEVWAVFVLDQANGVARLTPVELGHRSGAFAEVRSGLDEGALVLVHPSDRVVDGARVAPRAPP